VHRGSAGCIEIHFVLWCVTLLVGFRALCLNLQAFTTLRLSPPKPISLSLGLERSLSLTLILMANPKCELHLLFFCILFIFLKRLALQISTRLFSSPFRQESSNMTVTSKEGSGKNWKWGGCTNGRYGRFHLTINGESVFMSPHRASSIAFNEQVYLNDDIPHEKLCVNPEHLSHEPHHVS